MATRGRYAGLEWTDRQALLDAACIYGRLGRLEKAGRCFQRYYEESTAADLAWEYGGEPMERSLALRRRHYTEDLAERLGLPLRRRADKDLYFNCAE